MLWIHEKTASLGGFRFVGEVDVVYIINLIRLGLKFGGKILFNAKCVLGVRVRQILIIGVLGDVVLIREEGAHAPKLQDALAAVHHRQLIYRGKVFAQLLIVQAVGHLPSTALAGVKVE